MSSSLLLAAGVRFPSDQSQVLSDPGPARRKASIQRWIPCLAAGSMSRLMLGRSIYQGTSRSSGSGALAANTTRSGEHRQGVQALYSNTIGSNNTANGVSALRTNTEGNGNGAIGVTALRDNRSRWKSEVPQDQDQVPDD
jgi:hypothetical protein